MLGSQQEVKVFESAQVTEFIEDLKFLDSSKLKLGAHKS